MKKNKTLILTLLFTFVTSIIAFAETSSNSNNDSNWQSEITGMLGGIPISSDVTYSYASSGSLSADVYCMPSKSHPQVGESVTVTCVATPRDGAIATPPVQTQQIVTESGGKTSVNMEFNLIKHIYGDDPYDLFGKTKAVVNANVYEGTTGLGSNSTTDLDTIDPVVNDNSNNNNTNSTNPNYNGDDGLGNDGLGDVDWGNLTENSNGTTNGQDNLDSYFNNGEVSPDTSSSDLLGTDGYVEENPSNNNATQEISDINYEAEGLAPNGNGAGAYDKNGNYVGEGYGLYDAFGNYVGYKAEENNNGSNGLASSYKDALAGMNKSNSNNSLLDKILDGSSDLAKKTSSLFVDENSPNDISTNQDLYDIAKKLLISSGLSLDDIKKGKNYDKGSAYSEPTDAWDLNRITTLMSSKKIKLDNNSNNLNQANKTTSTAKTIPTNKTTNKLI